MHRLTLRLMNGAKQTHSSTPHHKPEDHDRTPADLEKKMQDGIRVKARMWFEIKGETFISMARVTLLERIIEHGSITRAAHSMKISYRHAWKLVESMNRLSSIPVVQTQAGGIGGGGTQVTKEGYRLIKQFKLIHDQMENYTEKPFG